MMTLNYCEKANHVISAMALASNWLLHRFQVLYTHELGYLKWPLDHLNKRCNRIEWQSAMHGRAHWVTGPSKLQIPLSIIQNDDELKGHTSAKFINVLYALETLEMLRKRHEMPQRFRLLTIASTSVMSTPTTTTTRSIASMRTTVAMEIFMKNIGRMTEKDRYNYIKNTHSNESRWQQWCLPRSNWQKMDKDNDKDAKMTINAGNISIK